MFKLIYNLEETGEFDTFEETFADLYKRLTDDIQTGMSWQLLETAIWIEAPSGEPMMFYEARDCACKTGLLIDGQLNLNKLPKGA